MKKKLIISMLALLSAPTFAANGIQASVELNGVDTYKVEKNVLQGDRSSINGQVDMLIVVEGQSQEVSQVVPVQVDSNNMRIEVVSKDEVRLIDDESGINTIVKADVKKSLFGRVKSVYVSSEELEAALKPVLDAQGLDLAKGFHMKTDEGSFSMDYKVSAMECNEVEKNELECRSSFVFNMSVQF
ncbi:hypothetical protein [Halobacteriovorax sp. DPLXC-1]|uniref:hypothetical protein n=1 Tax=unclassified Halobacteriovorax TaxID=2639665 RepID=UPI002FEF5A6F